MCFLWILQESTQLWEILGKNKHNSHTPFKNILQYSIVFPCVRIQEPRKYSLNKHYHHLCFWRMKVMWYNLSDGNLIDWHKKQHIDVDLKRHWFHYYGQNRCVDYRSSNSKVFFCIKQCKNVLNKNVPSFLLVKSTVIKFVDN